MRTLQERVDFLEATVGKLWNELYKLQEKVVLVGDKNEKSCWYDHCETICKKAHSKDCPLSEKEKESK